MATYHCFRTRPWTRRASRRYSEKPASNLSRTSRSGSLRSCGPQGIEATITNGDGSGKSNVTFGQRLCTRVVNLSRSAGSTGLFAALGSGIWFQLFMSSRGMVSRTATRSFAHSFSRSFFFIAIREQVSAKPNSCPPLFRLFVFAITSTVTFGELAMCRGGSIPSSNSAVHEWCCCSHCCKRPFASPVKRVRPRLSPLPLPLSLRSLRSRSLRGEPPRECEKPGIP
mmetsp:Transcript_83682/g.249760  ORF Transcript_83682/g.249760 Transcript_83682/m.249760 type:complete len:226 (-) Transcript_83682:861-1538(-)